MAVKEIDKSRATYSGFINGVKWAVPLFAILTFFIVMAIAP